MRPKDIHDALPGGASIHHHEAPHYGGPTSPAAVHGAGACDGPKADAPRKIELEYKGVCAPCEDAGEDRFLRPGGPKDNDPRKDAYRSSCRPVGEILGKAAAIDDRFAELSEDVHGAAQYLVDTVLALLDEFPTANVHLRGVLEGTDGRCARIFVEQTNTAGGITFTAAPDGVRCER